MEEKMLEKKIAVMIYPHFSMQEISCLTAALSVWHGRTIDVFASSKDAVLTEDGFRVVPEKTFAEFDPANYCCLVLPGILNPLPALFDEANIAFLQGLADFSNKGLVVAAISSAPMLLAKAGLLEGRVFTCAIWQDIIDYFDFIPSQGMRHVPLVRDGSLITAIGFAYQEFAVETLRAIGIDCQDGAFAGVSREYTNEELTFRMEKADFEEFLEEYRQYAQKEDAT